MGGAHRARPDRRPRILASLVGLLLVGDLAAVAYLPDARTRVPRTAMTVVPIPTITTAASPPPSSSTGVDPAIAGPTSTPPTSAPTSTTPASTVASRPPGTPTSSTRRSRPPGTPTVQVPARAVYRSCAEARAAGAAPMARGQRGYVPKLDDDRDGIACETRH